jgi:hypothetical protein
VPPLIKMFIGYPSLLHAGWGWFSFVSFNEYAGVSFRIPSLVSAKWYRTGSSGSISRNARVILIAVGMPALLRSVRCNWIHIRYMCVSTETISFLGGTSCHPPGSTRSSLTIHRRKRLNLLHALFFSGKGKRLLRWPLNPLVSSLTKNEKPGSTVLTKITQNK